MSFGNVGEKDVGEKHQHRRLKMKKMLVKNTNIGD
jgi:hypothetical protein